jgi:hypothetical protein
MTGSALDLVRREYRVARTVGEVLANWISDRRAAVLGFSDAASQPPLPEKGEDARVAIHVVFGVGIGRGCARLWHLPTSLKRDFKMLRSVASRSLRRILVSNR